MPQKLTRALTSAIQTLGGLAILYVSGCVLSALLFALSEGRAITEVLWWAFVTATTTGYGDISPQTLVGRIVGVTLMHFGTYFAIPLTTALVTARLVRNEHEFTHQEQVELAAKVDEILSAVRSK